VFSSGGPLRNDTANLVKRLWGAAPIEIYGSTESGGIAWRRQTEDAHWTPLPEVLVDTASDGALLIRSPFIDGPMALRMEDMADLHADGRFTLSGRLDRIVKIEEKRLSLPEMEAWLAAHAAVGGCAVAPVSVDGRTFVGAVVVASPAHRIDRKSLVVMLKEHLRQKFDPVLLPRRWRFVEQLPYNERGKLPIETLVTLLNTPL
jgi:acyl-coenzyme A synthetase/AMP-(fatty) acid ligase